MPYDNLYRTIMLLAQLKLLSFIIELLCFFSPSQCLKYTRLACVGRDGVWIKVNRLIIGIKSFIISPELKAESGHKDTQDACELFVMYPG
jgi:hypothetical protein